MVLPIYFTGDSVLSNLSGEKKQIFFWERIAFRIVAGFLLPLIASVYALFVVSSTFSDISEVKERVHQLWIAVRVAESNSALELAKVNSRAQALVASRDFRINKELEKGFIEIRGNLENARKNAGNLAKEFNVPMEVSHEKYFTTAEQMRSDLSIAAKRISDELHRGNGIAAGTAQHSFEQMVEQEENLLIRIRAMDEILESKVMDAIVAKEAKSRTQVHWMFVLVLLFGIGSSLIVTYSILYPINQVVDRFKDIAKGEGDLTKRVHARAGGELSELAHWMNVFLERTEAIIGTIGNAAEVIKQVTERVSEQTTRTSQATGGINRMMLEQSHGIETSVRAAENIDDLLQNAGESTKQAATLSRITMDRAAQGGESVQEMVNAMEKIEESSTKVEELVGSINEIAAQTNLLAINAAIEATKAGEHGKGFAVVAEEVRKLAERARRLTAEVTELMDESSNRVKTGVSLAKNAGRSLGNIIKDIESVASLIQRIATGAAKQTETSSELREGMHRVSESVRQNLLDVESVTKTANSTGEEVGKLRMLVEQMNAIVGQFRLGDSEPSDAGPLEPPAGPGITRLPEGAGDIDEPAILETELTAPILMSPAASKGLDEIRPSAQLSPAAAILPPPPPLPNLGSSDDNNGGQEAA